MISPCTMLSSPSHTFKTFEILHITLQLSQSKLTVFNIYHPSPLSTVKNCTSLPFYCEGLNNLFSVVATTPHEFIITGDFNLHLDDLSYLQTKQFLTLLDSANPNNMLLFPAHIANHTFVLVITHADSKLKPDITFPPSVILTTFLFCLLSLSLLLFLFPLSLKPISVSDRYHC